MYVTSTYLQYEPPFCFVMHVPPFLQPTDKHDEPASYMNKYKKKFIIKKNKKLKIKNKKNVHTTKTKLCTSIELKELLL